MELNWNELNWIERPIGTIGIKGIEWKKTKPKIENIRKFWAGFN